MNPNIDRGGFWHQWDIEVLNFQVVSLLNFLAVAFLAAMSKTFDWTKIVDSACWNLSDLYIFVGPVVASLASLVLVDSATWLVSNDYGAQKEAIIYWVMIAANTLIQVAGNGASVLMSGVYVLIVFGILAAFTLLPIVALSNPVSLALTVLFFLTFIGPIMTDTFGFFLFGSFAILTAALVYDYIYLLITEPTTAINSFQDVFDNGLTSATIQDFEDTVEVYLGKGFTDLFGIQTLQDILDDIVLHLILHGLVMAPIAVTLAVLKSLAAYGAFSLYVISLSEDAPDWISKELGYLGLGIVEYFFVFDGTFFSFIDSELLRLFSDLDDQAVWNIFSIDFFIRTLLSSLFSVESDYWGIYFMVRLFLRQASGEQPGEDQPQVTFYLSNPTLEDLASMLTPDYLEEAYKDTLEFFTKPMIIGVLLPLVQVLTWAYQVPFFQEIWYYIRGIAPL